MTFQMFTGISEFYVTRWVDKTWQEAGILSFSPGANGFQLSQMAQFFQFFFIWLLFSIQKSHITLWKCQKPLELPSFSAGESRTTVLR